VEQKRRGKQLTAVSRKEGVEAFAAVPLTQGKLNAVRAAFKAGVYAIENCPTIRNFTVGCTQGVGV